MESFPYPLLSEDLDTPRTNDVSELDGQVAVVKGEVNVSGLTIESVRTDKTWCVCQQPVQYMQERERPRVGLLERRGTRDCWPTIPRTHSGSYHRGFVGTPYKGIGSIPSLSTVTRHPGSGTIRAGPVGGCGNHRRPPIGPD